MDPTELGRQLREGDNPFLANRRWIIGLSLFSCAALGISGLYQVGILKKLPQPPGAAFNSEKVHGSRLAYGILKVPDSFLGLVSYAMTAALAAAGSPKRAETNAVIPIAMACKLMADAGAAGFLTFDEVTKIKALSIWSFLTAVPTAIALPLAFPEAKAALQRIKS